MTVQKKENNKKWFKNARFGMFIHWGLFSITARDMWYYSREEVAKDEYEKLFHRFNPVDYDPCKWAETAKEAGMKYAVFITKHHDGFCFWDSKYTDFKVTNTPYKKDIFREWVDAFRKEGIGIGIYYSLIDWHHPHFTIDFRHPQRKHLKELNKGRDFSKYVEFMHNQIRELMIEYGEIKIFWPDGSYNDKFGTKGKHGEDWKAKELKEMVEKLQPGILVNNRLGCNKGETEFDFTTPEQFIPDKDVSAGHERKVLWEACETMGASWGYFRGDPAIKPAAEIIKHLVTCAGFDGNLLLNIGPTPRGEIQEEFVERLKEVGKWLKKNGESVFGAGKTNAELTSKSCPEMHAAFTRKDNNLYMHCFDRYPSYNVIIKDLGGKVEYAELLDDKSDVAFEDIEIDGNVHLRLFMPVIKPDPYDTVIKIVLKEGAVINSYNFMV